MGEYDHSRLQTRVAAYFFNREKEWPIRVVTEHRLQVTATRFRIPDICAVLEDTPVEAIFRTPPFLCIEILSKDDSFKSVVDRLDDYLAMGGSNIWVIEPLTRRGYTYSSTGFAEATDGVLRTGNPALEVPLSALFD